MIPFTKRQKMPKIKLFWLMSKNNMIWHLCMCIFVRILFTIYTNNSDDIKKEYAVQVFYTKNTVFSHQRWERSLLKITVNIILAACSGNYLCSKHECFHGLNITQLCMSNHLMSKLVLIILPHCEWSWNLFNIWKLI